MRNLLAFDLGASNGRAILGQFDGEKLTMRELHRFENTFNFPFCFSLLICFFMEAKLPVILHDQLSSVDYSCCRFPQKESNEYCCSHKEEKF